MSHEVESMFSDKLKPWHYAETQDRTRILEEAPTDSAEAMKLAGADWEVYERKVYWEEGTFGITPIPNRKALVRLDPKDKTHDQLLSVVSTQYEVLQNVDAFKFFDPITSAGIAKYETAGVLSEGKKIWILARLSGDFEVGRGDVVRKYILLCNGHDGQTGLIVQPTPIRVVCNNTLQMSLGMGLSLNIRHHQGIKDRLEKAREVLGYTKERYAEIEQLFFAMKNIEITDEERVEFLKQLFPHPGDEASDYAKQLNAAKQDKVLEIAGQGYGSAIVGAEGTLWHFYNACIEFCDWHMGQRSKERTNYLLFGQGAAFKNNAMIIAKRIIKGRGGRIDVAESGDQTSVESSFRVGQ